MVGMAGSAGGVKRKRMPEPKFYAVHRGTTPGIYRQWDDCKTQISGVKGAVYKSFTTLAEAQDFLAKGHSARPNAAGPPKYYGVQAGKTPGVYTSWDDAQAQVVSGTKPRYKSFATRAEAEAFVEEGINGPNAGTSPPLDDTVGVTAKKRKKGRETDNLAQVSAWSGPGEGPLPPGAEDGFDTTVILDSGSGTVKYKSDAQLNKTKAQASGIANDGELRIWTDGSSRGNGTAGAMAGVGVYFGPGDRRNLAEPLQGPRQTNQRAELTAILRALELSPRDRPLTILTDSKYAIQCVTEWFQKWRSNGWVSASKKPVENRDLVEKILGHLEEREKISQMYSNENKGEEGDKDDAKKVSWKKGRARVQFQWVKGHADDPGNVQADALAVAGAMRGAEEVGVGV